MHLFVKPGGMHDPKHRPLTRQSEPEPVAVSLFLQGCAVGPKYKAPPLSGCGFCTVSQQVGCAGLPQHSAASLDVWWTGFNDPMLVTIVERALSQNLDLAASLERVNQVSGYCFSGRGRETLSGWAN